MKYLLRGLALGVSLNMAARICTVFYSYNDTSFFFAGLIFYIIITLFLISDDISHMLLTGFSGIISMFVCEIYIFMNISEPEFMAYVAGMYASVFSIVTASLIICKKLKFKKNIPPLIGEEEICVNPKMQIKLLTYLIITAILLPYLVLPESAGISVVIFAVIQFVCLCFVVADRKRLLLYIPIFIMALNCFISANTIWIVPNCILSIVLFCCMFVKFDIKRDSLDFLPNLISHVASPFLYFKVPFSWGSSIADKKAPVIKRIALALAITIPCIIALVLVLSKADMVFSVKANIVLDEIFKLLNINVFVKIIIGTVIALFLFGAVCHSYKEDTDEKYKLPQFKGDLIVINIVLTAILFIYTLFVIVQFKYLFAGKVLPDGFTYTEYARKGFFELLALTGVNIAVILTVIKLTKQHFGKWLMFTKTLCHYLCAVTIVLLISSYFRMNMYVVDDGLTRLRLFVIGFLVFEAIGLLVTFLYIAKPKFNLTLVYVVIALTYYAVLNVIPADYIIAKNQIDKYLDGTREDISYVFTLSADAAPALEELRKETKDENMLNSINMFLEDNTQSDIPKRWQRFNLSVERAKSIVTGR